MLDVFAKQKLDELINHFNATVNSEIWNPEIVGREKRRADIYNMLSSKSHLESVSYEKFCAMIEELWALRGWHNKTWFIDNQMGLTPTNYQELLDRLSSLLFGTNELEVRLEEFMNNSSGFGVAIISELLTLSAASKYALFNAKSQAVLKSLRIDLKEHAPRGKKKDIYLYIVFNKVYSEILEYVQMQLPQVTDFYRLDAFFWLLNFSDKVERIGDNDSEEDKILVVKLGRKEDVERIKNLWKKHSVASFGFPETNNFDPIFSSEDRYADLKKEMESRGAPEGLIKKVASYVHTFFSAIPNRDWVVAYHKGKLYGFGRVSSQYVRIEGTSFKDWNQALGVKWTWFDQPVEIADEHPNLYQECGKNSSVSLLKKRSARTEFFQLVKGTEVEPEDIGEISEDGITLEAISLRTFLPKGYLEQLISSFLDEKGKKQAIFDGPPGTGKTFVAQQLAKYLTNIEGKPKGDWRLLPCHGSLSYEQVFQGLGPDRHGKIGPRSGVLTDFARRASENEDANFVLILDELNRANIHQVFGPLLFLLEYRGSEMDLPFGSETALLPPNLFIIATMNSDDRSAGFVDFAFRRRFISWYFDPSSEVLKNYLKTAFPPTDGQGVDIGRVVRLFEVLNRRLGKIDPNFQVGHSYFMTYYPPNEAGLQRLWETEIVPLLEEKFFHNQAIVESEFSLTKLSNDEATANEITAEQLVRANRSAG